MRFSHCVANILMCGFVAARSMLHNGILFSESDITRAKYGIDNEITPYYSTYQQLLNSEGLKSSYAPRPAKVIVRGPITGFTQNYPQLYVDAAVAYQVACLWTVTGDELYGNLAVKILTSWANTLENVTGNVERFLASGIYGYQLAVTAEMMRNYEGFTSDNQTLVKDMLLDIFYPLSYEFLTEHNGHGPNDTHYWSNWDLCNIACGLAVGVYADRPDIYEYALEYLHNGGGMGTLNKTFPVILTPEESNNTFGLAEGQESGRDQGHAGLEFAFLAIICQIAYLQGDDLWSYNDNVILKGAEYFARYNLGYNVPFKPYYSDGVLLSTIGSDSRGDYRPIWSLYYATYVNDRGFNATYIKEMFESNDVEEGGGWYGPNSGGYDQLGFGSLAYWTYGNSSTNK